MVLMNQDSITSAQKNNPLMSRAVHGVGAASQIRCSKLYIGNLSTEVTDESLREFFTDYGIPITYILKMMVKKGFAFVEFIDQAAADLAIDQCNGKPFMNTVVRVEPAIQTDTPQRHQRPKLVQLLFTNCNAETTIDELRSLIAESHVNVVSIEGVRSGIQGSSSFIVRVPNLRHAQHITEEWNNKIVSGCRIQIQIMEESFSEGAGDPVQQYSQNPKYFSRNASYPVALNEGRFSIEKDDSVELPLRILIPNEFIGAIIGRGGATIRAISKGTGARVDIFRHFNRNYEIPEKPISISGAPEKATQACKKILEIIAQEADHQNRENHGDIALKIFTPNSVVGRVIGKSGSVIKQIMEDTQTKIHISNQPDFIEENLSNSRSNQRIITIRGSIEGMSQAETIISSKLREAYNDGKVRDRDLDFGPMFGQASSSNSNSRAPFFPQTQSMTPYARESRYPMPVPRGSFPLSLTSSHDGISLSRPETSYMYVPDESVGALIGRKGSSIREIIHSSGASIKVLEGIVMLNECPFRRVVIHGGVDSLFLAEYLIYQRVLDEANVPPVQMDDPQLTIEMTVPTEVVGRLIGKGGSNIREIQRQHFCRIKFLTEPDLSIPPPADGETYVRITGTAHAFLGAQKKIRALLVKAMNRAFSVSNNMDGSRNEATEEENPTHEVLQQL